MNKFWRLVIPPMTQGLIIGSSIVLASFCATRRAANIFAPREPEPGPKKEFIIRWYRNADGGFLVLFRWAEDGVSPCLRP